MRFKNLVSVGVLLTGVASLTMAWAADPVVSNGVTCIPATNYSGDYYGTPVFYEGHLANASTSTEVIALCPIVGFGTELDNVQIRVRDGHSSLYVRCEIYCQDEDSATTYHSGSQDSTETEQTFDFDSINEDEDGAYSDGPCMVKCSLPPLQSNSPSRVYAVKVTPTANP
ncbi:MAG TPA: hypothetical protein VHO25_17375 [Polyangiaceae bacterium]|nr:hypothetical protein [Polyangiaceae bacterium]